MWKNSGSGLYVGSEIQVFRYDFAASSWSAAFKYGDLFDVWGFSDADVYAVGGSQDDAIPERNPFQAFSSPDGVDLCGKVLHYDGDGWTKTQTGYRCGSVWGSSSSDVYARTYYSKNQHNDYPYYNNLPLSFNGTQRIDLEPQFSIYLRTFSIWGTSSSDIFIVGWNQNIYRGPMPGFRVCPKHGFETGEDGSGTSFVVRMKSKPSSDVTVSLASTDTTEATVSPSTLSFTPSDWFDDQTVNVTGVDDDHEDGDVHVLINVEMQNTDDPNYKIQDPDNRSVLNKDDGDKAGIATCDISSGVTNEAWNRRFPMIHYTMVSLADNQIGDLDDIVDRIKDPGGMARFNGAIPTMNVFGLAFLALAIGLAGWMKKRRRFISCDTTHGSC